MRVLRLSALRDGYLHSLHFLPRPIYIYPHVMSWVAVLWFEGSLDCVWVLSPDLRKSRQQVFGFPTEMRWLPASSTSQPGRPHSSHKSHHLQHTSLPAQYFFIVNTIGKFKMLFATVKQEYFQMRRMQDVSAHLPSWNKLGSLSAVSQHCIYPMGIVSPRFSQRRCFATKSKQRPEQLLASHHYSPTQLLICFHSLPRHFSDLGHIY